MLRSARNSKTLNSEQGQTGGGELHIQGNAPLGYDYKESSAIAQALQRYNHECNSSITKLCQRYCLL